MQILKIRRVILSLTTASIAMILMFYFDAILSDHLLVDVKVSEKDLGYFFALICFCYAGSAPLILWICKKFKRRYVI